MAATIHSDASTRKEKPPFSLAGSVLGSTFHLEASAPIVGKINLGTGPLHGPKGQTVAFDVDLFHLRNVKAGGI